jgi:hypothetical protein
VLIDIWVRQSNIFSTVRFFLMRPKTPTATTPTETAHV